MAGLERNFLIEWCCVLSIHRKSFYIHGAHSKAFQIYRYDLVTWHIKNRNNNHYQMWHIQNKLTNLIGNKVRKETIHKIKSK